MTKKGATMTLRLTEDLKSALDRAARQRGSSMSAVIVETLNNEFDLTAIFNATDEEREYADSLYALESARDSHLKFLQTATASILRRVLDLEICDAHVKTVAARILYDRTK